jgi:ketosteroid isomerase-like protein
MTMSTSYVVRTGDLALLRGEWRLSATEPKGKEIELKGKNIEVARRQQDGGWLFVIDHPFGTD